MRRIQVSLAALVGLIVCPPPGCAPPAENPPAGGVPAASPPPASPPAAGPVSADSAPVEFLLKIDWNENGRAGLRIAASGKFVATLDELRAALPDLPGRARSDPRYLHQLVHGLMTVTNWTSECIGKPEDIAEKLQPRLDPGDVLERHTWNTQYTVSAPSPLHVKPPRWEGDTFVIDCVDPIVGMQDTYYGTRHRFTLGDTSWTHAREDLAAVAHVPERARALVTEAFGGEVRGFIRFPRDQQGALYVALGPAAGTRRYLWRPTSGEPQRFATWAEFSQAVGVFNAPAALAEFAGTLHDTIAQQGIRHDNYRIIADPAAYREDYRTNRRDTHVLRYYVDKLKTTRFTVRDFDAIQPPKIEGERLVAYFSNGRGQPVRLDLDLSTLDWGSPLPMVELFEERVISDTGNPLGEPIQTAPDPEDIIERRPNAPVR